MIAIVSFLLWLWRGKPEGRHVRSHATTASQMYLGTRRGRGYRRPDYRWMPPDLLMAKVRERDQHTATRPMRWWEQDSGTPDLKQVVTGMLGDAGTWTWNSDETVGVFRWS